MKGERAWRGKQDLWENENLAGASAELGEGQTNVAGSTIQCRMKQKLEQQVRIVDEANLLVC